MNSDSTIVDEHTVSKVVRNEAILPIGQALSFDSSSFNSIASGNTIVSSTQNTVNQSVQMYQSGSFENCENLLDQQSSSGQAFLLASPGTVLSSNQISQGQVYIQGDELVGVSLPSTSSGTYTLATNDSSYGSAMSLIHGGTQQGRLILQQNQSGSNITTSSSPIISTNNGHYLIQVKNPLPDNLGQNGNLSINSKGHIVIKSGSVLKIKAETQTEHEGKDDIFRVVIPKGTTKLPKLSTGLPAAETEEAMRKHVQINLSNRTTAFLQSKNPNFPVEAPISLPIEKEEKLQSLSNRKYYECTNCNSRFMKALYLRMHTRSCKKVEVKPEKRPLYMCSFCKSIFKTKPQINHHFSKCANNPSNSKDKTEMVADTSLPLSKRTKLSNDALDFDPALEQAVQYKCQDCDRTFNKERQYTSHIKKCTNISVHDLSGLHADSTNESAQDEDLDQSDDPFADPPATPVHGSHTPRRGRGGSSRRGRPPGKLSNSVNKALPKNNVLFDGETISPSVPGMIVADNENLIRSTTGLAHTLQLTLDKAAQEGQPTPTSLVSDSKGFRGRQYPPQAWSLVCSLCQKMYLTKAALATHVIESHGPDLQENRNILLWQSTNEKDFYRCPMCDLHYQCSEHFTEHLVMQHTNKLRECHQKLQAQTANYVCSMCSLVLLTKNLLMEHLSLEHLDELEKIKLSSNAKMKRKLKAQLTTHSLIKEEPEEGSLFKSEDGNPLECRFCGISFESQDLLVNHYVSSHNVETDEDGVILDLGFDVDIRIKDTQKLLQMGNIQQTSLPKKTVLIRKKPKQSWQCQKCHQIFSRQAFWARHVREVCQTSTGTSKISNASKETKLFCQFPECSHISFNQFKSLVKHKEEVHNIVVRKERKVFKNISAFYDWLTAEEDQEKVFFIRDSSKIEKNNDVRLIQMVCHRFHSAKTEQSKEKESDYSKPTKKRWFVRIQRENNCHARIHLRVEINRLTNEFEGETQMIYYPDHFHNGIEDTTEILKSVKQKYPLKNGNLELDSGNSIDSNTEDLDELRVQTSILSDSQKSSEQMISTNTSSFETKLPTTSLTPVTFTSDAVGRSPSLFVSTTNSTPAFILPQSNLDEDDTNSSYMVMSSTDMDPESNEEYMLPADESEWTKLFQVLQSRIDSGEIVGDEQKEAEELLTYRNTISLTNLPGQVSIFLKMCSLTNTSLEHAS